MYCMGELIAPCGMQFMCLLLMQIRSFVVCAGLPSHSNTYLNSAKKNAGVTACFL